MSKEQNNGISFVRPKVTNYSLWMDTSSSAGTALDDLEKWRRNYSDMRSPEEKEKERLAKIEKARVKLAVESGITNPLTGGYL